MTNKTKNEKSAGNTKNNKLFKDYVISYIESKGGMGMDTVRPIAEKKEFHNFILREVVVHGSLGQADEVKTKIGFLGNFFSFC